MRRHPFAWSMALGWLMLAWVSSVGAEPLPEGAWRGEFTLNDDPVPFNFEIARETEGTVLTLLNGSRRDNYRLVERSPGEWVARLGTFNTELVLEQEADGQLAGLFRNLASNRQAFDLPFRARKGERHRFVEDDAEQDADATGKWRIATVTKRPAPDQIAELRQQGNRVTGVLLTVVGDSRELEGNLIGDELFLSGFTGPAPVYLRGRLDGQGGIEGTLAFGGFITLKFSGQLDDDARLPDPYTLTTVSEREQPLELEFPDLSGLPLALSDPRFHDKVVVIQVLGTWCPNCVDESRFLAPWHRQNQARGVEVVGIAFEAEDTLELARPALELFRDSVGVDYPILYGGSLDKTEASAKLPRLNKVLAYPTTIFLDRQGRVREIHTGFSSQDTGPHYEEFVYRFNRTIDQLLDEAPAERVQQQAAHDGRG